MARIYDIVIAHALVVLAACGDNGTVLGSMASGAATGSGGSAAAGASGSASGGSSSGGSAGSSNPSSGGSSTPTGGSGGNSGGLGCTVVGDCKSVVQNVAAKLAAAQVCYPSTMPEPQCPAQIDDGCGCPVSVVSADAPATKCFLEALAQLNSLPGCYNCVPSPCVAPTGQCSNPGDGSDMLHCH